MGCANPTGYSASVRLWLRCGDQMVPLSHTAERFVIAWEPVDLPPGDAEIVYTIDNAPFERPVTLIHGMSRTSREATVRSREPVAPF